MSAEPLVGELIVDGAGPRALDVPGAGPREALLVAWLGSQRSENTAEAYRRDVGGELFRWCDQRKLDVLTLSRWHIDAWRRQLTARGLATTTVNRKLTAASSFYRYGLLEAPGLVPGNPVANVKRDPVEDESTTIGLTQQQAERFLTAAGERSLQDLAVCSVLLGTGVRVSELCGADVADLVLDGEHWTLWITAKGKRRRRVFVPEFAALAVLGHLDGRARGPLFVVKDRRINRKQVDYRVKVIGRAAGLGAAKLSPHVMRHTAATLALSGNPAQGIQPAALRVVQQMLGHIDPRTTNRYDRAKDRMQEAAGHVLGAMFGTPR